MPSESKNKTTCASDSPRSRIKLSFGEAAYGFYPQAHPKSRHPMGSTNAANSGLR